MRPLGLELARQAPIDIDIYFTHTHLDHIIGLTFFAPLFEQRNSVRLWAGHLQAPHTLKKVVSNLMQAPLYPVSLEVFQARVEFNEFKSGDKLALRRHDHAHHRRSTIPTAPPAIASSMAASRSATSPTPSSAATVSTRPSSSCAAAPT